MDPRRVANGVTVDDREKISLETIEFPSQSTTSRTVSTLRIPLSFLTWTTMWTELEMRRFSVSMGTPVEAMDMYAASLGKTDLAVSACIVHMDPLFP